MFLVLARWLVRPSSSWPRGTNASAVFSFVAWDTPPGFQVNHPTRILVASRTRTSISKRAIKNYRVETRRTRIRSQ